MNLSQLTARDLMTKELATINSSETLRVAARRMRDRGTRCLLVEPDKPGEGVGVITTKDIIVVLDDDDPDALIETHVADVMTRPAVSVQHSLGIYDCVNLMRMTGVRRVPVLDGSELLGMLSYSDVFTHVVSHLDP